MSYSVAFQPSIPPTSSHSWLRRLISTVAIGSTSLALLTSCGGSSEPEPQTIALYMQSEGLYPGDPPASCAENASTYAARQRWFQEEILQKRLKLKVASSECRYKPQTQAVPDSMIDTCLAEYRYQIVAEGTVQSRSDIALEPNVLYAPEDLLDDPNVFAAPLWIWGERNSRSAQVKGAFDVEFPPKFTTGYVSCGN